jgi:hypothetical protein
MLDDLKFVSGAIAKKDFVPTMKHFLIHNGTVRAYNGVLTLSSPISLDIDCKPLADPMMRAIINCAETVNLSLTGAGRLEIQSGKFKAFVECTSLEIPDIQPEGTEISLAGIELVKVFKKLFPLIGTDASRPWVNGIYLNNKSCYVTNNAIVCQYWLGIDVPAVNIPREAIKEIIRVGTEPTSIKVDKNSISFMYESGRWIKTKLIDGGWPNIEPILNAPNNQEAIDLEIFKAIDCVEDFCEKIGILYFSEGIIHTSTDLEVGGRFDLESIKSKGAYNVNMLKLLNGLATSIDWSSYPKPCIFYGDNLRGAIIGMKSV